MSHKVFDFTHEDFQRSCPAKQKFIKLTFNEPITEEDFVKAFQSMPKHIHWSRGHSPHKAKDTYRRLRDDFGFFQNGVEVRMS